MIVRGSLHSRIAPLTGVWSIHPLALATPRIAYHQRRADTLAQRAAVLLTRNDERVPESARLSLQLRASLHLARARDLQDSAK